MGELQKTDAVERLKDGAPIFALAIGGLYALGWFSEVTCLSGLSPSMVDLTRETVIAAGVGIGICFYPMAMVMYDFYQQSEFLGGWKKSLVLSQLNVGIIVGVLVFFLRRDLGGDPGNLFAVLRSIELPIIVLFLGWLPMRALIVKAPSNERPDLDWRMKRAMQSTFFFSIVAQVFGFSHAILPRLNATLGGFTLEPVKVYTKSNSEIEGVLVTSGSESISISLVAAPGDFLAKEYFGDSKREAIVTRIEMSDVKRIEGIRPSDYRPSIRKTPSEPEIGQEPASKKKASVASH